MKNNLINNQNVTKNYIKINNQKISETKKMIIKSKKMLAHSKAKKQPLDIITNLEKKIHSLEKRIIGIKTLSFNKIENSKVSITNKISELEKCDLKILDKSEKERSYAEQGYLKVFEKSVKKSNESIIKTLAAGFLGGFFIAMGYIGVLFVIAPLEDAGKPISALVPFMVGFVFTIAILAITFIGGSLFTSNCMGFLPLLKKNITNGKYWSRLFWVLVGNYIGTFFAAVTIYLMGELSKDSTFGIALNALYTHKGGGLGTSITHPSIYQCFKVFIENMASGIWCNIVIGATLWFTYSFRDAAGTILACFFGILVFGASGFQHVVANSFPYFASMLSHNQVGIHSSSYGYFIFFNLLPAGIGNWIGGALILPLFTNVIFKEQGKALSIKMKIDLLKNQLIYE